MCHFVKICHLWSFPNIPPEPGVTYISAVLLNMSNSISGHHYNIISIALFALLAKVSRTCKVASVRVVGGGRHRDGHHHTPTHANVRIAKRFVYSALPAKVCRRWLDDINIPFPDEPRQLFLQSICREKHSNTGTESTMRFCTCENIQYVLRASGSIQDEYNWEMESFEKWQITTNCWSSVLARTVLSLVWVVVMVFYRENVPVKSHY